MLGRSDGFVLSFSISPPYGGRQGQQLDRDVPQPSGCGRVTNMNAQGAWIVSWNLQIEMVTDQAPSDLG